MKPTWKIPEASIQRRLFYTGVQVFVNLQLITLLYEP